MSSNESRSFVTINCRALFLLSVYCLTQIPLSAESKPLQLKWTELAPVVASQQVTLKLSDGGEVTGEAVVVREDTLVLDVRSITGTTQYAKGNATVPRNAIKLIVLTRTRSSWGRSMGTTLGIVTGLGAGGIAASHTDSPGVGVTLVALVTSGVAVFGYYAGKALDQRTTRITMIP
jgi:hypothetical protein